jgi:hypothetical protein
MGGTSARNFSAASRGFRGEAKGEEGGVRGLFIAGLGVEEGLGFARNQDRTAGRCRARVGLRPEEEEGADMWGCGVRGREGVLTRGAGRSARGKKCRRTLSGALPGWAVGCFRSWAELVSPSLFFLFRNFPLFFILKTVLFHNFFICASI